MAQFLGLMILSILLTGILLIPFIDFLYKVKLRRQHQKTKDLFNIRTPLFDKFHGWKVGTPIGGGLLVIAIVTVLTFWAYGMLGVKIKPWELFVLLFAFIGYGALGFYDDVKKMAQGSSSSFFGLRFRHKFVIQWVLAFVIAFALYYKLHFTFIFIHGIGPAAIGFFYIPLAAFIIVSFANAVNIADGLDGLASGLLLICLGAFLAITSAKIDRSLGIFIAVLMGSFCALLYFNIYKARIWMGDVGSLAFGAVLAVIGLLTGKIFALVVIGGVFVIEVGSSLIQILSKKFLGKKAFAASPAHLYLQQKGWEEPKIVMRMWLLGFVFAIIGLYLAFIT